MNEVDTTLEPLMETTTSQLNLGIPGEHSAAESTNLPAIPPNELDAVKPATEETLPLEAPPSPKTVTEAEPLALKQARQAINDIPSLKDFNELRPAFEAAAANKPEVVNEIDQLLHDRRKKLIFDTVWGDTYHIINEADLTTLNTTFSPDQLRLLFIKSHDMSQEEAGQAIRDLEPTLNKNLEKLIYDLIFVKTFPVFYEADLDTLLKMKSDPNLISTLQKHFTKAGMTPTQATGSVETIKELINLRIKQLEAKNSNLPQPEPL